MENHLEVFQRKLNALLVEENAGIRIVDGQLAYYFPKIRSYFEGETLQEMSEHKTGGIGITGKEHLGLAMPSPTVWISESEYL